MNLPLHVIQDGQGRLRDVNDQPMIMIFDSKARHPRTSQRSRTYSAAAKEKETRAVTPQSFAFINVKRPNEEEDEEARRLIRTHVMQDLRRRQRQRSTSTSTCSSKSHASITWQTSNPLPQKILSQPTLIVFPVPMQPYMRRLIQQYSSSIMYITDPQQPPNPADSAWFPMVMTDPALFHAILCTSAIYRNLISGSQEDSFPQRKHMLEAISLINARLDTAGCISDATIMTIIFIAKAEYVQGNYRNWNIHMNGLKRIVKIRGGMMMLPSLMPDKIYNAELIGCIETGSIPRFPFINDNSLTNGPSTAPPSLPPSLEILIQNYSFDTYLITLLHDIEKYTCISTTGISSLDLEPTALHIRYQLLSWTDDPNLDPDQCSVIQQCVRLGAMLYMETLLRKPSVRGIDYTVLVSSLQSQLRVLDTTCCLQLATTGLRLWLLCIGGFMAGSSRDWFKMRLRDGAKGVGIETWEDVKILLVGFWWIEDVHEGLCRRLWEEFQECDIGE